MEADTPTQSPAPNAADPVQGTAAPEPAAAPPDLSGGGKRELASFEDALRAGPAPVVKASTVPEDGDPAGATPNDEPAPNGDVKSEEQQQPRPQGGRRSKNAEENLKTIEELRAELETVKTQADPEKLREQIRADLAAEEQRQREQAANASLADAEKAAAEHYERLNTLVDDHPLLNQDSPFKDEAGNPINNYVWLQQHKRTLSLFPEAVKKANAIAARQIAVHEEAMTRRDAAFWTDVRSQIAESAHRWGVDPKAWLEPGVTWARMADDIADAREKTVRADLEPKLERALERARKAEAEVKQFALNGRGGLAAAPVPAGAGRSAPAGRERPDWKTASGGDFFSVALAEEEERRQSGGR